MASLGRVGLRRARAAAGAVQAWHLIVALLGVVLSAAVFQSVRPATAQAQDTITVWRSPQFGLKLDLPAGWRVVEQRTDPERGDVVIVGNETSALLIGLLHDTRTPREMADDLVVSQKMQTPDLAVIESSVTETGAVLMFLQYTIQPGTDGSMLIDEKALVGQLEPGVSTVTVRGMVPDRANVEAEFAQIESMIGTLVPER
jgi:hypothetical protein